MIDEKFFDELEKLKDVRRKKIDDIKSRNLPVVIFGAGATARDVERHLFSCGIDVAGFAVDEKYYKPGQTYLNRPVYNFSELSAQPDKYIFVLGMGDVYDGGKRVEKFLTDDGLTKYVFPVLMFEGIRYDFIRENEKIFSETFDWLEDDFSKRTMKNSLKAYLSDDFHFFSEVFSEDEQYFNELTDPARGGVFVDCGAFRGDTVEEFIRWSGGSYKKIFAFEPDPENFVELKNFVREKNFGNVSIFDCGVGEEKTCLMFRNDKAMSSTFSHDGGISVEVEKIDNIVKDEPVNFIKMDVEGGELSALKGAAQTIKKNKPILALSAYHKPEDLITLPQYIKSIHDGYKLYLRKQYTHIFQYELILYAV